MSLILLPNAIVYYSPQALCVGYIIPTVKKKSLLASKRCFKSNDRYWYNCLYPYCSLSRQGEFSVLVNKAVDLLGMEVPFI